MEKINWNNPEEVKEYKHQYYLRNREKLLEKQREYRKDNSVQIKQYYQNNKEKRLEQSKQWRKDNKEYVAEYNKLYYQTPLGRAYTLLRDYKRNDKKHNRGECTLTAKWIVDNIFTKHCEHCGETDWTKLGCNRINNDLPHTPDNVEPCCTKCNIQLPRK